MLPARYCSMFDPPKFILRRCLGKELLHSLNRTLMVGERRRGVSGGMSHSFAALWSVSFKYWTRFIFGPTSSSQRVEKSIARKIRNADETTRKRCCRTHELRVSDKPTSLSLTHRSSQYPESFPSLARSKQRRRKSSSADHFRRLIDDPRL